MGAAAIAGLQGVAFAADGERLQVSVGTRAIYDSNLVKANKSFATARGLIPEDLRLSPSLDLVANLPVGGSRFFADAALGYDFHNRNKKLDRERLQAHAGVQTGLRTCVLTVEGSGARQQTELEDIIFETVVNTETIFSGSAGLSCPREGGISPSLSVRHSSLRNSALQRQRANNDADNVQASLSYGTKATNLALTLLYSKVDFPERPLRVSPFLTGTDGFKLYQAGLQLNREVGAIVRSSVSGALTRVEVKGERSGFNGNTFSADLRFLPYSKIQPHVGVQRSLDPINRLDVLYRVQNLVRADTLIALTPRMQLTLGGSWRHARYRLSRDFPGQVTRERTSLLSAGLNVDVHDRIDLSFFAQKEKRVTNVPLFSFNSNRVGLSTKLTF